MKFNVYTIRDTIAEESGPIFTAKNDAIAFRQFADILSKVTAPKDFKLIFLGKYDTETGVLIGMPPTEVELVDTTENKEGV